MEVLQLKLALAQKEVENIHLQIRLFEETTNIESPQTPPISPPYQQGSFIPEGESVKKRRKWGQYDFSTSTDMSIKANIKAMKESINPDKCHIRRCPKPNGIHKFQQCRSRATKRGGYCQTCIQTHEKNLLRYPPNGQMKISVDGDIRIWGGKPEQVCGIIRDTCHNEFLSKGVCQDLPLQHIVKIPDDIIKEYNLPKPE